MAESTALRRGHELVLRLECMSINGDSNNDKNAADDDNGIAVDVDVVISNISDVDKERGSRRMAVMRRRRVKGGGGGGSKPELAGEEKITTDKTIVGLGENIATVKIDEEPALVVEAEESTPTVVKTTNRVLEMLPSKRRRRMWISTRRILSKSNTWAWHVCAVSV
jgi:hypothetical protein